jgi:hypothetical protein
LLCEVYYSNFHTFSRFGEHSVNIGRLYTGEDARWLLGCVSVVTCTPVDIGHSFTKAHSIQHVSVLTKDGVYKNLNFNTATKLLSGTTYFSLCMLYFSFVISIQVLSSLTGRDTLYSISVKLCIWFPLQAKNQYTIHRTPQPCWPTRQLRPSCLETACHATLSCHFIVWVKLLSLAMICHCICSMHHVLTCSFMSVVFHLYFVSPTFWDWWHRSIPILLTALELFLLYRNSILVQWQTNVTATFLNSTLWNTNEVAQAPYMYTYKTILISVSYGRSWSTQQHMALICVT